MTPSFWRRGQAALFLALCAMMTAGARADTYVDYFRAVNVDNVSGVRQALEKGLDPNSRSEQGQHALYLAIRDDSPGVLELLWTWPGIDLNTRNALGETPLMMAALKGRIPVMKKLLSLGVSVNQDGWTPLHYAASGSSSDAVALLLEQGAHVDARSPNGSTPLMLAARYGVETSVELLVAKGANLVLRNDRNMDVLDFAQGADRDWMVRKIEAIKVQRR